MKGGRRKGERVAFIAAGPSQIRRMLNKPMVYVAAPIANDNGKRGGDDDAAGKRGGDSNETTMPTDAGPLPLTESVDATGIMNKTIQCHLLPLLLLLAGLGF